MRNKIFLGLSGFLGFVLLWTFYAYYLRYQNDPSLQFVPYPIAIVVAGYEQLFQLSFWTALVYSSYRVISAFLLSIMIGIPVGIFLGWWGILRAILGPSFNFGRYLPVAALVPLSIVILGVSDLQKIVVLFAGTLFHVIVMIEDAVARIPPNYIDTAKTMGFSSKQVATKVILPSIYIAAYDAGRVAMGLCWSYLMVAEIVASEKGVGYLIIKAQRFLQIEKLYFFIIVLGIIGLLFDLLFVFFKPRLFPWYTKK